MSMHLGSIRFSSKEIQDLLVAWAALGLAFTFFFEGPGVVRSPALVGALAMSLVTAGLGFLLHELAHKVAAIRFGQVAEFRADYGMLFVAVVSGLAGFLFAAPGAVYHRGRATPRENGLIALAGPATNVALGLLFLPVLFAGSVVGPFVAQLGTLGVAVNFLLAGFNMIPFGPLDGNTVKDWSLPAFLAAAVPCYAVALWALFLF